MKLPTGEIQVRGANLPAETLKEEGLREDLLEVHIKVLRHPNIKGADIKHRAS